MVHPEIEWFSEMTRRMEGAEAVYRGTDGMRRYWADWHAVWDVALDISDFRDLGDTVVALGRIQAHGGASGVDLDGPIAFVFEFDGPLVRKARSYLDHDAALADAGLA